MKVRVKTYGTFTPGPAAARAGQEIEMEIPEGANVGDLLAHLGISPSRGGTVVMNGRILSKEGDLVDGALVQIFQVMHGG